MILITRCFDILISLFGLVIGLPLLAATFFLCLFDTGSPIFFQKRVGRNTKAFTLVKFRTLAKDTPSLASHLVEDAPTKLTCLWLNNAWLKLVKLYD